MGYIKLGQSSTELSVLKKLKGVKLALELSKDTGRTMYYLMNQQLDYIFMI